MLMSFHNILYTYSATSILLVLPRFCLATLPPALRSVVPQCTETCLDDFLQRDFTASSCPDLSNIDCLCSHYGVDGFTLGEIAYSCLYSSETCSQAQKSNGMTLYSICSGRKNAVSATHKTIIVTATPTPASSSSVSTPTMTTATGGSLGGSTSRPTLGMPSESSTQGVMTMGNISLTMAQIAGITIAAAAVLILTVGIATCLIFVKRNKRMQEMEDHKILLHYSPRHPGYNYVTQSRPPRDPRSGKGGVGITPFPRPPPDVPAPLPPPPEPPVQRQQWPRYYPIMPDEIGLATTANYPLPAATKEPAAPIQQRSNRAVMSGAVVSDSSEPHYAGQYVPPTLERQSTGIILPQQPAAVHTEPVNSAAFAKRKRSPNGNSNKPLSDKTPDTLSSTQEKNPIKPLPQPKMNNPFRPTSAMTEFEEDDPLSPMRANFASLRPGNQLPFVGPQTLSPVASSFPVPPTSNRPKSNARPPTLSLKIPAFEAEFPLPPPPLQRPPLVRVTPDTLLVPQSSSQHDLHRSSTYSSAIASSQALGSTSNISTAERSSSSRSNNRRRPSRTDRSGRDSQASFTSFESFSSDEDEITPPKEEQNRLSPVHETHSRNSSVSYPKIPRFSNQAVPRSPPIPSPRKTTSQPSSPNTATQFPQSTQAPQLPTPPLGTPFRNQPISQSIGNRLWKTEKSPQNKRPPIYTNWDTRQEDNWSWASPSSSHAPSTPLSQQQRDTSINTPLSITMPVSPFGAGSMPKLTPTRRGDELFLSVN